MPQPNDLDAQRRIEQLARSTDEMAVSMMELATLVHGLAHEGNGDLKHAQGRLLTATKAVLLALDDGLAILKAAFARPEPVDVDSYLAYIMGLLRGPLATLDAEVAAVSMVITSAAPVAQLEQARLALDRLSR